MLKIYFFSSTLIKLKTCTRQIQGTHHTLFNIYIRSAKINNFTINSQKIGLELN